MPNESEKKLEEVKKLQEKVDGLKGQVDEIGKADGVLAKVTAISQALKGALGLRKEIDKAGKGLKPENNPENKEEKKGDKKEKKDDKTKDKNKDKNKEYDGSLEEALVALMQALVEIFKALANLGGKKDKKEDSDKMSASTKMPEGSKGMDMPSEGAEGPTPGGGPQGPKPKPGGKKEDKQEDKDKKEPEKDKEKGKTLEVGDSSDAFNAIVEGIQILGKQLEKLASGAMGGTKPEAGAAQGMDMPAGGEAKGKGMEGGGGEQGAGMAAAGAGGAGAEAGGAGGVPKPREEDAFLKEDGSAKDSDEVAKQVGQDYAKNLQTTGEPTSAAVLTLAQDGQALSKWAETAGTDKALAPVKMAGDLAQSFTDNLEGATTQTYNPQAEAAAEQSKADSKNRAQPAPPSEKPEENKDNKPKPSGP